MVNWGVIQVANGKVIVLVDGAVAIRGDSESGIALALEEAKSLISGIADSHAMIASVSARLESAAHSYSH